MAPVGEEIVVKPHPGVGGGELATVEVANLSGAAGGLGRREEERQHHRRSAASREVGGEGFGISGGAGGDEEEEEEEDKGGGGSIPRERHGGPPTIYRRRWAEKESWGMQVERGRSRLRLRVFSPKSYGGGFVSRESHVGLGFYLSPERMIDLLSRHRPLDHDPRIPKQLQTPLFISLHLSRSLHSAIQRWIRAKKDESLFRAKYTNPVLGCRRINDLSGAH